MNDDSAAPAPPTSAPTLTTARVVVKVGLGLVLAGGFGYFFLRGSDLRRLAEALAAADPFLVTAGLAVAALGFLVRAERWRCYLRPIRAVSFRSSFEVLMIGYMVSNLVPGRLGDFLVRPLLMDRSEGIAKAATLATVAVERLFDTLVVVLALAGYLAFFAPASLGEIPVESARLAGAFLLAASLVGLALLVVLRFRSGTFFTALGALLRPLGPRWSGRLLAQARSFSAGLDLFRDARNALVSFAWSIAAWATVALSMWLVCRGFGLDAVRLVDSGLLIGMGAVGVAVPAPGGVGSFHYFMLQGLRGLGVEAIEVAQGATIVMWGIGFVPVVGLGMLAALGRGLRARDLAGRAAEGGTA